MEKHDASTMLRRNQIMICPDSKVHGASMGPIWGRQDPGGPHVGPMNFAIWVEFKLYLEGTYFQTIMIIYINKAKSQYLQWRNG